MPIKIFVWRWNSHQKLRRANIQINDYHPPIQLGKDRVYVVNQKERKEDTISIISKILQAENGNDCILFLHTSGTDAQYRGPGSFNENEDRLIFNEGVHNIVFFGGNNFPSVLMLQERIINYLVRGEDG